jgi:hypothetical protein
MNHANRLQQNCNNGEPYASLHDRYVASWRRIARKWDIDLHTHGLSPATANWNSIMFAFKIDRI